MVDSTRFACSPQVYVIGIIITREYFLGQNHNNQTNQSPDNRFLVIKLHLPTLKN
jgi:hypothetical protein